nr:hypothetical protein [Tanacetum cinerariifolium]
MESVTKSNVMALLYGMLLTRLFKHVRVSHYYDITDLHDLVDHVMIPFTEGRAIRIMPEGKRHHPQTPMESSESQSPNQNQEENNLVNNYTLDLIVYIDQLLPIEGGESLEFKQTKGMSKCFGDFLSNLRKKK